MRLRIGTRGSALALWQSRHVAARLAAAHRELEVELVEIISTCESGRSVMRSPVEMISTSSTLSSRCAADNLAAT